jgi:[ribosomal protein S5]-alanine N-acetyltransferase
VIESARLRLEPLDMNSATAIAAGARDGNMWHPEFPRPDDKDAARMAARHDDTRFGCRVIVEKASGLAIGTIGFFGPPDESGTVIVGYGLVPAARGAGYATEALRTLVQDTFHRLPVNVIVADPLRDNVASHRVLEKAGFTRTHSTEEAHWYALGTQDDAH